MNLVGKIFTVIVFLMSMVCMTIALMVYSASTGHPTWKKKTTDYRAELDVQNKKFDELQKERKRIEDQLKHEVDLAQARLAALEAQYLNLRKEHEANNKLILDKEDEINSLAASVRDSHKNLESLRGIALNLRDEIKASLAARDGDFQKVLSRTDEFHNLIAELERLQKQNRVLLDEIQEMESTSARTR